MNDAQNSTEAADPKLVGIRDWLILPAIGLVLGPIISIMGHIVLLGPMSGVIDTRYGGVLAISMLGEVVLLVFMIYAATRFFGRKSNAPRVMITNYVLRLGVLLHLLLIELGAGAESMRSNQAKRLREVLLLPQYEFRTSEYRSA